MTKLTRSRLLPWVVSAIVGVAGAAPAQGQGAVITGKVASEQGQPLQGANVYITELNVSVGANEQGRYTINLPADRVRGQTVMLRVRSIGFKPAEKQVTIRAGSQTVDFAMAEDVNRLQEVVVTGVTGATTQAKLPFTVSKVDASQMPVPGANPLSQLQGKVPGAQIVSANGRPGASPSVLLRGPKSINASGRSQGPLYIVDGIAISGDLPQLNPQDIESVEVVKGAAAASLYGSRAGNGVIQITTKRGNNAGSGLQFGVRSEQGAGDIPHYFNMAQLHALTMDATGRFCDGLSNAAGGNTILAGAQTSATNLACARAININEEALRVNENELNDLTLNPVIFYGDFGIAQAVPKPLARQRFQISKWPTQYNAIDQVTTPGAFNNVNVDATGKFGSTSFFASINNNIQQAPFETIDGFRRQSLRLNVDNQVGDNWRIGVTSYYSRNNDEERNGEGSTSFFTLTRQPAGLDMLATDKFGRLFARSNPLNQGAQNINPLYRFDRYREKDNADRFLGALNSRYTPLSWLTFEGNFGYDRQNSSGFAMNDRGTIITQVTTPLPSLGANDTYSGTATSYNASLNTTATHNFWNTLDTRWNAQALFEEQDASSVDANGTTIVVPGLTTVSATSANFGVGSGNSSVRSLGYLTGVNLTYRDRYIVDALVRRDGSSLFGVNNRWRTYGRGSLAWRVSQEPWWFIPQLNELKLRASYGTAGGRPSFAAQYETFTFGTGGTLNPNTLGNKDLKPETTAEQEYGIDAELFNRVGVNLTFSHAITTDQILPVPPSVASGFTSQWRNAGTLDNQTWEASVNLPIFSRRNMSYSWRVNYDQNYTKITKLLVPPFFISAAGQQGTESMFRIAEGERYGTIYGHKFMTDCSQLPAPFNGQCGPGQEYQKNNEGLIVYVGQGHSQTEGITNNLWESQRPGCLSASGNVINTTGILNCLSAGGTINAPFAVFNQWGNPIAFRDSTGSEQNLPLGHTLPTFRLSLAQTFTFKKFSAYGLLDGSFGQKVWNEGRHWALGDLLAGDVDQRNATVENAKPIAHYWRAGAPDQTLGNYGFYDLLQPNNVTTEDASYAKIREVNIGYNFGAIGGVGDWTLSLIGRNLYTFTGYTGFDPETGRSGGTTGSAVVNGVDAFQYPNTRTFTISIGTRF